MKEIFLPDDGEAALDPDLEARLVAMITGEASAFEEEALERLLAARPEVAARKRALAMMHELAGAAVCPDDDGEDWKLSPERRTHVMEVLGIGRGGNGGNGAGDSAAWVEGRKESRIQQAGRKVLWAAAACVMINVILFGWLIGRLATGDRGMEQGKDARSTTVNFTGAREEGEWESRSDGRAGREGLLPPPAVPEMPVEPASGPVAGEEGGAARALAELGERLAPPPEPAAADPFSGKPEAEAPQERDRLILRRPTVARDTRAVEDAGQSQTEETLRAEKGIAWRTGLDEEKPGKRPEGARLSLRDERPGVPGKEEVAAESSGGAGGIVANESARRSLTAEEAEALLHEGREAYTKGNYEEAVEKYEQSYAVLPGGFATDSRRDEIAAHLADGQVALAQQKRRRGQYDDAREGLEKALTVDPDNAFARQELEYLDDPIRGNQALTYEGEEKIAQVREQLYRAEGYKNLGRYDEAIAEYQQAQRLDGDNTAARRGIERIDQLKSDYSQAAHDETRTRLLVPVDESWEMVMPPAEGEEAPTAREGVRSTDFKSRNLVIPELNLKDATVAEALDLLRQRTRELDTFELDPNMKGLNFVVQAPSDGSGGGPGELSAVSGPGADDPGQRRIKDLNLKDATVEDALAAIADQTQMRFDVDDFAITMAPREFVVGDDIVTRRFKVPPTFVSDLEAGAMGDDEDSADPFGDDSGGIEGTGLMARRPLVEIMKESGIEFPPNSSVQYLPATGELIVSNTPENLDLVDQLTESVGAAGLAGRVSEPDERLFKRRAGVTASPERGAAVEAVEFKLKNTIVPVVDFDDTTMEEVVDYLRQRSRELDGFDLDGGTRGIEFHISKPTVAATGVSDSALDEAAAPGLSDPGQAKVRDLKLRNVPISEVLKYACAQAKLRYQLDENGITFFPLGFGVPDAIETRSWEIHPDVLAYLRSWGEETNEGDPFAEALTEREKAARREAREDRPLREVLMESGIDFPSDSSVQYIPGSHVLIVSNTSANLDLVDAVLVDAAVNLSEGEKAEDLAEETLETKAQDEPFSTFSLHVSDVSFKLAKASLEKGEWPAPGQLRVEEFVNAFDYGDPAPSREEMVACRLEQAAHPFMQQRNLLRIGLRTAAVGRTGETPLSLTVLLDHSGSMERLDRAEAVRRAFDLLAEQLRADDQVTLISFARTARLLADRIPGSEAGSLAGLVATTPSGGGTNLEEAMRLGLSKAMEQRVEGGQNRVILLTDGAANLGNAKPEDLARVVERLRQLGIAFDACGVGAEGLNDEILESLTRKGDGRYYFLDRPEDADAGFARQIAGALRPAAKNVKVQVAFNPQRVGYYKLYGFDKHRLETEDFRNDSVDAAELAAEEAGNALYQVEVRADGEGPLGTVAVRFQDVASGRMVERTWTIPYAPLTPPLPAATPSMRLAGSAAFLGEKLDGSAIGERVHLGELVRMTNSLRSEYPASERVRELIEMVAKARGLDGE